MTQLRCGTFLLNLDRPLVMGIVNVTPDSFSDGGQFLARDRAVAHAKAHIAAGADLIDIGGESTRPGAHATSLQEELDRVLPVLEAVRNDGVPVSIDTQKPEVMNEAIRLGASMINDVNALQAAGALAACASGDVAICLMHRRGDALTMQREPSYRNVVAEVKEFLLTRAAVCEAAGVMRERIVIDPGFGFGKTVQHNFQLLHDLASLIQTGYPVLAGFSRKNSLGIVTGKPVDQRLASSLAVALLAVQRGAKILRVHDVTETIDMLKIIAADQDAAAHS
jgi:dihydropteroate synthase